MLLQKSPKFAGQLLYLCTRTQKRIQSLLNKTDFSKKFKLLVTKLKMESHSHKIYSSSFSSSSSSLASHDQHEEKKEKPYLSTLHGVRSLPSKSITKKPIAPSSPIPPKIYRVEAVNFRQVVQMLTAAPEFQSHSNFTSGFQRTQEVILNSGVLSTKILSYTVIRNTRLFRYLM